MSREQKLSAAVYGYVEYIVHTEGSLAFRSALGVFEISLGHLAS